MGIKLPDREFDITRPLDSLHDNERLKHGSGLLRGTIANGLQNSMTGALPGDDPLLIKFHGLYQQDNRDVRAERKNRMLEPAYSFMVRLRLPGGQCSVSQWQALDEAADKFAEGSLRITTRQTVQVHGVRKNNLKPFLQLIRDAGLDTIAACGDDNRGVVCGINPAVSRIHAEIVELARETSNRFAWKSGAYKEIWLDEKGIDSSSGEEQEPLYGATYLPRKFKIGFILPPVNDVDIYAQDLGFIAIVEDSRLTGFDVVVGGGMGRIDNREDSYPRAASLVGYIPVADVCTFAELVIGIQRDFGNRVDRHRARFKYTLDYYGLEWFADVVMERWGRALEPARQFTLTHSNDRFGWYEDDNGMWYAGLFIPSGRIKGVLKHRLAGFFQQYGGKIRLTANQNLVLTGIDPGERLHADNRLNDLGLRQHLEPGLDEVNALACVGFPTCGLAMAESERYLPTLLGKVGEIKKKYKLQNLPIKFRITGCPNGCSRPYLAEIALTGRSPGRYNLYIGGGYFGQRLNYLYKKNIGEQGFLQFLDESLKSYKSCAGSGEKFGDFLLRNYKLTINDQE